MKTFKTLIAIVSTLFLTQNSYTQINNDKGEIVTSFDYFDADFLAKNKIKTISISYSSKKSMKPIIKNKVKRKHYDFDSLGRITRFYSISNYGRTDEIEWRKYKENKIHQVFKPESGRIGVYTFYYDEGKNSIRTYGKANNISGNSLEVNTNGYKEIDARYFNYVTKPEEGKKTKETMSFNKVIFLRNNEYYKDSLLVKEETRYRYFRHKNNKTTYKYNVERILVEKSFYPPSTQKSATYKFSYYSDNRVKSIKKYQAQIKKLLENREFVYSEETGFLQAIISQNKVTGEMIISKFKYTFL